MRIIAGMRRGMNLLPPKGHQTRPITDRAKEALFSVLHKYDLVDNGVIADLFCGTGSMGLECLSRGARWVTFVDRDPNVMDRLGRNIAKARFADASKVVRADAFKVGAPWPDPAAAQERYDVVFVDPPYRMTYDTAADSPLGRLLRALADSVVPEGLVVVRTHHRSTLVEVYDELRVIDRRQWGTTAVSLLQRQPIPPSDPSGSSS